MKDGNQWGIKIEYRCQNSPDGIAQALLIAEEFLNGAPMCLILGDNLFYGDDLANKLRSADKSTEDGTIFAYQVSDPNRYGIVEFDENNNAKNFKRDVENIENLFYVK